MATVTFQTLVCNHSLGIVTLKFQSHTVWGPSGMTAHTPVTINVNRSYSTTSTVILSIQTSTGQTRSADDSLSTSAGPQPLSFKFGTTTYTLSCHVS
jgi:hypothetical protein